MSKKSNFWKIGDQFKTKIFGAGRNCDYLREIIVQRKTAAIECGSG